jgi:outer membrane protein assembly factor BamD
VTEKIHDCRDKHLQYEIYVGRFYLKTGKYIAAIGRFEVALKTFPELPRCDEVLYYLWKAYQDAEQQPKAREAFDRLVKEFPASRFAGYANKAIGK